jgi:Ca2+/Na+ antiporter
LDDFNLIIFLWRTSFVISILTFIIGLLHRSWLFMLISTVTFLPVAYYFLGALNAWRLVGYIPILLFSLTVLFWFLKKRNKSGEKIKRQDLPLQQKYLNR